MGLHAAGSSMSHAVAIIFILLMLSVLASRWWKVRNVNLLSHFSYLTIQPHFFSWCFPEGINTLLIWTMVTAQKFVYIPMLGHFPFHTKWIPRCTAQVPPIRKFFLPSYVSEAFLGGCGWRIAALHFKLTSKNIWWSDRTQVIMGNSSHTVIWPPMVNPIRTRAQKNSRVCF